MDKTKYSILLVDDEEDILDFVSYNLRKEGFVVHTSLNGRDALKIAKKDPPNLILLDLMMPEMDGIETCQELKRFPELKETIIVFFTARSEDFTQILGLDAGADDYITKPIKPSVLSVKSIRCSDAFLFKRKNQPYTRLATLRLIATSI